MCPSLLGYIVKWLHSAYWFKKGTFCPHNTSNSECLDWPISCQNKSIVKTGVAFPLSGQFKKTGCHFPAFVCVWSLGTDRYTCSFSLQQYPDIDVETLLNTFAYWYTCLFHHKLDLSMRRMENKKRGSGVLQQQRQQLSLRTTGKHGCGQRLRKRELWHSHRLKITAFLTF